MSVFKRAASTRLTLVVALLAASIVGCTSIAQPGKPAAATGSAAATDRDAEALPSVNLTANLLFRIMSAEVAQQRGDAATAYASYQLLARQTRDPRLARRATEIALAARMSIQAVEGARLWVELEPRSTDAAQALAALLVAAGQLQEARPLLEAQLKAATEPVDELVRLQRSLARNAGPEAFALFDALAAPYLKDGKRTADVHLLLAAAASSAGLTERAIREARAAVALAPDSERMALMAAQTLVRTGPGDVAARAESLAILRDYLMRHPEAADARMASARVLIALNRTVEAKVELDEVLKRNPSHPDALYARGVLALDGKPPHDEARRLLLRYLDAIELQPGQAEPDPAYLNLARIAEDERRFDEALQWLRRIEEGDQYLTARTREAYILNRQGQLDAALNLLRDTAAQPARSDEDRALLVSAQGQLLREAKRYQASFDLLDAALAKSPDSTTLLYDAAMAAEKIERLDLMEKHLRRVMELKPRDAHAFNALGYSLADRNLRLDEAQQLIAQALTLSPDDGYILDSMGWVLYRRGDLAGARDHLEQAWKARPEAEVGAHLGEVLWQMGRHDEARRIWREAIAADPDSDLVQTTLARLKVQL